MKNVMVFNMFSKLEISMTQYLKQTVCCTLNSICGHRDMVAYPAELIIRDYVLAECCLISLKTASSIKQYYFAQ